MKKILKQIMALGLVLLMVVGCSGKDSVAETSEVIENVESTEDIENTEVETEVETETESETESETKVEESKETEEDSGSGNDSGGGSDNGGGSSDDGGSGGGGSTDDGGNDDTDDGGGGSSGGDEGYSYDDRDGDGYADLAETTVMNGYVVRTVDLTPTYAKFLLSMANAGMNTIVYSDYLGGSYGVIVAPGQETTGFEILDAHLASMGLTWEDMSGGWFDVNTSAYCCMVFGSNIYPIQ